MGNRENQKGNSAGLMGVEYQLNITTMFLLNALRRLKGTTWELWMEHSGGGKFDDVVLKAPEGDILLQAKCREAKKKKITLEDLHCTNSKRDQFSLAKYFFSYLTIKSKFQIKHVILCTNAEVNRKVSKFLISHRVPPESLLQCSCDNCDNYSFYAFNKDILPIPKLHEYLETNLKGKGIEKEDITDANIKEFFEKLQFYSSFPPNSKFEAHIEEQLLRLKLSHNFFGRTSFEDIHLQVRERFKDWQCDPIQADNAKAIFCEIKSNKYCEALDNYNVVFSDNDFSKADHKQVSLIKVESGYLLHVLRVYEGLKDERNKILYAYPDDGADTQRQIIEAFKQPKYTTLVIVYPKFSEISAVKDMCEQLQDIMNLRRYKKVVLITKPNNTFAKQIVSLNSDNYIEIESLVTFNSFSKETQWRLLKAKNILFQGTAVSLEELLKPVAETDFEKYLCCHQTLEDLVKKVPISVGLQVQKLDEDVRSCYIPRKLNKELDDYIVIYLEEDIYSIKEKIILITDRAGMGKTTTLIKIAEEIKNKQQHTWVIMIRLINCSRILQRALRSQRQSLDIEELLRSSIDTKFKKSIFSMKERVVLLLDAVDEVSPDYTDLIVDLLIKCQQAPNFERVFITTRPYVSQELEKKLQVTPFMFEPFTERNQIEFLTNYFTLNLKLADKDKDKCETYAKLLVHKVSCELGSSRLENHFAGIPMLVGMLGEIFVQGNESLKGPDQWEGCKEFLGTDKENPVFPEKLNLSKLHELFVEKKREVFLDKENPGRNITANIVFNNLFDECLLYYEIFAIENVFGDTVCRYFTSCKQANKDILLKIGILQEWNGEYQFVQRTFAEYFVAKCLVRELQKRNATTEFKNFLLNYLVENVLLLDQKIVEFFNSFLKSIIDYLPCDTFHNCALKKYEIDEFTFVQTIAIFHNLAERNLMFILQFLLQCLGEKGNKLDKKIFLGDFFKEYFKNQNKGGMIYDNLFKILQLITKEGGINIINDDKNNQYSVTPLQVATRKGHIEMVKFLVSHGANVYLEDSEGCSPLLIAAQYNHLDIVQFLFECEATAPSATRIRKVSNVNTDNEDGDTALYRAVSQGNLRLIKSMVQNGVDINIKDKNGDSILHRVAFHYKLNTVNLYRVHSGVVDTENKYGEIYLEIFEYLIRKGADMNAKGKNGDTVLYRATLDRSLNIAAILLEYGGDVNVQNENGNVALHIAASKNFPEIFKFLVESGGDISIRTKDGNTALHMAALSGALDIVKVLVNHGAEVDLENKNGHTALHLAAWKNYSQIVKILVDFGGDIGIKNNSDDTALHLAALYGSLSVVKILVMHGAELGVRNENGYTPLHLSAWKNFPLIVKFLVERGADVSIKNEAGDAALHIAVLSGSLDIVKILVDWGAEVNLRNENSLTALHLAAWKNFSQICKFLVEKGAYINVKNKTGDTVLHLAAKHGSLDVVKILVEHGADLNVTNKNGRTALHLATEENFPQIVKFLVENGGDISIENKVGDTILHLAAACGSLDVVKIFLEHCGDVNVRNKEGNTALHIAASNNFPEIVKFIRERTGADITIKNNYGNTILYLATLSGSLDVVKILVKRGVDVNVTNEDGNTPLHIAASRKFSKIFKFLVENGGDITRKNKDGDTVLHLSATFGYLKAVRILLEHDADVNVKNNDASTALHFAAWKNFPDVVRFIVSRGGDMTVKDKNGNTALHLAASLGSLSVVRVLIEHGAGVNVRDKNGDTALHLGTWKKFPQIVRFLVEKGADINIKNKDGDTVLHLAVLYFPHIVTFLVERGGDFAIKNEEGNTVLHLAALLGSLNIVEILIKHGARINITVKNGNTALHLAAWKNFPQIVKFLVENSGDTTIKNNDGNTVLHEAALHGSLDVLRVLIERGAEVENQNKNGNTALHLAAWKNYTGLFEFLVKNGADIDKTNRYGNTVLHIASLCGSLDIVKIFVEHSAKVNVKNQTGDTALHLAAWKSCPQIVKFLVENGGDISIKNNDGDTALHIAVVSGSLTIVRFLVEHDADINVKNKDGETPLHFANWKNFPDIVKFIVERGGDIKIKDKNGNTVLHQSALYGFLEISQFLVENGADVKVKNKDGDTALHLAASGDLPEIVKFLVSKGCDITRKNKNGDTVLHIAALNGSLSVVKVLVEYGADVNVRNEIDETPSHLAASGKHPEIVRFLLENGADISIKNVDGNTVLHIAVLHGFSDILTILNEHGAEVDTEYIACAAQERVRAKGLFPKFFKFLRS